MMFVPGINVMKNSEVYSISHIRICSYSLWEFLSKATGHKWTSCRHAEQQGFRNAHPCTLTLSRFNRNTSKHPNSRYSERQKFHSVHFSLVFNRNVEVEWYEISNSFCRFTESNRGFGNSAIFLSGFADVLHAHIFPSNADSARRRIWAPRSSDSF